MYKTAIVEDIAAEIQKNVLEPQTRQELESKVFMFLKTHPQPLPNHVEEFAKNEGLNLVNVLTEINEYAAKYVKELKEAKREEQMTENKEPVKIKVKELAPDTLMNSSDFVSKSPTRFDVTRSGAKKWKILDKIKFRHDGKTKIGVIKDIDLPTITVTAMPATGSKDIEIKLNDIIGQATRQDISQMMSTASKIIEAILKGKFSDKATKFTSMSYGEAAMMKYEGGILATIKKFKGKTITMDQLEDVLSSEINDFDPSEAPMQSIISQLKHNNIRVKDASRISKIVEAILKETQTPKDLLTQIYEDAKRFRPDGQRYEDIKKEEKDIQYHIPSVRITFRHLGRWKVPDDAEGNTEDYDWEVWVPGEFQKYKREFEEWAKRKDWFPKVKLELETSEKNYVDFIIILN